MAHLSVFTLSCTLGLFSSESTSAPACGGAGCRGGACASSMPPGRPPLAWMAAGCRREGSCPRRRWAPDPSMGRGAIMPGASISCEDMSAGAEGRAQTHSAVGGKWCHQRGIKARCMTHGQTWTTERCQTTLTAEPCCTAEMHWRALQVWHSRQEAHVGLRPHLAYRVQAEGLGAAAASGSGAWALLGAPAMQERRRLPPRSLLCSDEPFCSTSTSGTWVTTGTPKQCWSRACAALVRPPGASEPVLGQFWSGCG